MKCGRWPQIPAIKRRAFRRWGRHRRPPGEETSYGNGGLIQREAVFPHPFPRSVAELRRIARNRSVDVYYHLSALPGLLRPLFDYWRNSEPERYAAVALHYSTLIVTCMTEHMKLAEEAGARVGGERRLEHLVAPLGSRLHDLAAFEPELDPADLGAAGAGGDAEPDRPVRGILERAGVVTQPPDFSALETGVAFQGNRLIRSRTIALEREQAQPPRSSLLTTVAQLPWSAVLSRLRPVAGRSEGG